jgi:uncharacterized LabA/DUF88 family protein
LKTACYVDGFNLYHAIASLGDNRLKWLNVRSLAKSYLRDGDTLQRTVFFTALNTWDATKRERHISYVNALEAHGVEVIKSRFDKVQKHCHSQDRYCKIREEKQTDVAIATELLSDCYDNVAERLILVTADSDYIPVVRKIRVRFPEKIVFLVAPPGRLPVARELGKICSGFTELSAGRIRQHQMPHEVRNESGYLLAARPALYGDR